MLLTTYTCESPTSGLIRNWCSWYRHEVTVTPGVLFTTQRLPTYLSKRPYYTQGVDLTKAHISRIRFTFGIVYTHIQAEGWVLALPVSRSITSQVSLLFRVRRGPCLVNYSQVMVTSSWYKSSSRSETIGTILQFDSFQIFEHHLFEAECAVWPLSDSC